jgi:hypothetical protein
MIGKFEKDTGTIKSLRTEFEEQIKDKYIETLDIRSALGDKKEEIGRSKR